MKQILLLGNLGWIFVLFLSTARYSTSQTAPATSCVECTNDNFIGLKASDFYKGLARYRKFHWNVINNRVSAELNNGTPFQDARSCWYSIETLKKFICLLEKYASSGSLRFTSKDLGIRFYYAAYDTSKFDSHFILTRDGSSGLVKTPLGMHHTLFLVPTYFDTELKQDVDFDPRLSNGFTLDQINKGANTVDASTPNLQNLFIWNSAEKNPAANLLILTHTTISDKIPTWRNEGRLCPPNCSSAAASTISKVDDTYLDSDITQN